MALTMMTMLLTPNRAHDDAMSTMPCRRCLQPQDTRALDGKTTLLEYTVLAVQRKAAQRDQTNEDNFCGANVYTQCPTATAIISCKTTTVSYHPAVSKGTRPFISLRVIHLLGWQVVRSARCSGSRRRCRRCWRWQARR